MTLQRPQNMSVNMANERAPRGDPSPGSRRFPIQIRSTFVRIPRRPG